MKRKVLLLLLMVEFASISGQTWAEKMQQTQGNFYDIQNDFEAYWQGRDITEKGKGYKAFKRWENFVEPRVYPSGDLAQLSQTPKNYQSFLMQYNAQNQAGGGKGIGNNLIASATFTPMGPFGPLSGNAGGQLLKAGRINCITVDPTNSNNLWIGSPAGGLWKSTNGGVSWSTNTDQLGVLGCSDLAIDPTNTNIMYLATGDGDAGDTRSIGVLKSTDGGLTWNSSGLTFSVLNNYLIRRLIINPSNTQIILAATNAGIYRTTNAGTTWSLVTAGSTYDLEFKPGNPNIVYAAGTTLRLSSDGGITYTTVSNGIPISGVNRMAIAVTPNDANYVYVLASSSTNSGFQGFYRSVNSAGSFSLMASTPNLLGWANNGSDSGGQGWYDLCAAASPLNKDEVVIGGVNVWRTLDGGSTWTIYGHWTGSGAPFTHADQHDLEFDNSGTLFNTNDGTVYKRTGATWTEISGTMNLSQIYKMGVSSISPSKWISGQQDNGTGIWTGSSYNAALGGDGMDCFIDRTNDNNMFGEYQNGSLARSTNAGVSWVGATSGLSGTAPWVTVWKQDPQVPGTVYVGYTDLFKSTNLAVSWSTLTPLPAAGTIREFAIAPSNNQIIYVLKSAGIYKTVNGGASWTTITGSVPVASALPEFICIDPGDPNNAWVVLSGYSAGNKVFMTTDGGLTWTNFSANLPNLPGNCLIYQPGTNDRIYVGMDIGIYYRDNVSANWTLYNQGLPNVPVSDFEISPANPTLLHAATFGRGVWVASLYNSAPTPVSGFSVTNAPKCVNTTITFTDQSTNSPTAWSWSVSPSAGVIINSPGSQNPSITFPNGGNYTVSVVASNTVGAGNTYTQLVTIYSLPQITINNSNQGVCLGSSVSFTASGAGTYTWSNSGGNGAVASYTPLVNTVYTVSGSSSGCVSSTVCSVVVNPIPAVTVNGLNSLCTGASLVLMANGASTYSWSNGANTQMVTVSPTLTTVYTVTGTSSGSCKSAASKTITVFALPNVSISGPSDLCIGNSAALAANGAFSYTWSTGSFANGITVNPLVSTAYTLTGMDANGCVNSSTLFLLVNPLPAISLTSNQQLVCAGEAVILSASGANTYTWLPGMSNNAQLSTTLSANTTFTCNGTDSNGCIGNGLISITVAECVSIKEAGLLSEIEYLVYPNPNNGLLFIEQKHPQSKSLQMQISDVTGKVIEARTLQFNASENGLTLDIHNLPPGVYFLNLGLEGKEKTLKIIRSNQ